jgi:NAD(P)-dependent dehydrogenase (short-subunit alcohol dehydrogenase family)
MSNLIRTVLIIVLAPTIALPVFASIQTDSPTILITGSNRGLGLEFARQYAELGWNVIATCRNPKQAKNLQALAKQHEQLIIEPLDVTSDSEVAELARTYAGQPIDVLLNNAGIYGSLEKQTLGNLDFEEAKRVLDVNALGPMRVSQAFLENVAISDQKKIVSLGGGMGTQSIGSLFGGHYFIKMSKAAHLMGQGVMQRDERKREIIITMISPGRVDTQLMRDSGWTGSSITAEESATLVIERIGLLDKSVRGKLIMYDGKVLPW